MSFFDSLLGRKKDHKFEVTHQAILRDLGYDEIEMVLGRPKRAEGGYVYWRASLEDIDPDYPDDAFFQISNKDFRGYGSPSKKPSIDTEKWFVLTNSEAVAAALSREIGGIVTSLKSV